MTRIQRTLRSNFVLLGVAALLFVQPVAANTDAEGLIGERPNAGGPPDEVRVRLAVIDIDSVSDKEQRFNVDVFFEVIWHDARLAVDPSDGEGRVRNVVLDSIWTPGITILNNRGLTSVLPQIATIEPDGTVTVRQRLNGPLAVNLELRRFPFDTQRLGLQIVSYRYTPSELVFHPDSELIANPATFSADGWRFEVAEPEFSIYRIADDGAGTSRVTFSVIAERNSDFFVLTLALPMTLILFMAWAVHWLQPAIIPARIGMSTATVFSLIALGVSFRLTLPQIDYLTQADRFVIYSTLLVSVSLGITVLATRWVNDDREDLAKRVGLVTRYAFPLIFLAIVGLTLKS